MSDQARSALAASSAVGVDTFDPATAAALQDELSWKGRLATVEALAGEPLRWTAARKPRAWTVKCGHGRGRSQCRGVPVVLVALERADHTVAVYRAPQRPDDVRRFDAGSTKDPSTIRPYLQALQVAPLHLAASGDEQRVWCSRCRHARAYDHERLWACARLARQDLPGPPLWPSTDRPTLGDRNSF